MSIIVLEGPDLAGKSTVAQQVMHEVTNGILLKKGPPSPYETIMFEYLKPLDNHIDKLTDGCTTLVLDRWHLGELVYGPLLRGRSLLSAQQADYIDMVLQTFGCKFLYVTASRLLLEKRYDVRGDKLIKREQLEEIWNAYEMLVMPPRRLHWEVYGPSYGYELPNIFERKSYAPRAGQYIGPVKPKVLLLGDERNDQRFIFPFVPERASSGHWLMGSMHAAEVNHMDVGIMNACEVDPGILFAQWWELGQPPIICLGAKAERQWNIACQGDWKDVAIRVNHPQWMRRFAYMSMESYGRMIKEAMDG